jgi:hypothetical protein
MTDTNTANPLAATQESFDPEMRALGDRNEAWLRVELPMPW